MIFSPEDFRITKKLLKEPGKANTPLISDGLFSKPIFYC